MSTTKDIESLEIMVKKIVYDSNRFSETQINDKIKKILFEEEDWITFKNYVQDLYSKKIKPEELGQFIISSKLSIKKKIISTILEYQDLILKELSTHLKFMIEKLPQYREKSTEGDSLKIELKDKTEFIETITKELLNIRNILQVE